MTKKSILIMLHCEQNTGYAIEPLERSFEAAARLAGYATQNIHWSYSKITEPKERCYKISYQSITDAGNLRHLIRNHNINTILSFDLPYPTVVAKVAHQESVSKIISYWGASMSSINRGLKLWVKRLEWVLRKNEAPTHFIFESESMRKRATHGRGVPMELTKVIPLGVDTDRYSPAPGSRYAYKVFGIPVNRKIIFFSGHMEERKGVRVLINAMKELERKSELEKFHLLICGNKADEEKCFESLLEGSKAKQHVTFGGYRNDIPDLLRSVFIGAIASTGWDSFTMSSVEMLASGLPLIVSELQGLKETIEPGVCGQYIKPGDEKALVRHLLCYYNDMTLHSNHSFAARNRAETLYSIEVQIKRICDEISIR